MFEKSESIFQTRSGKNGERERNMSKIVLFGEPMAQLIAQEYGKLEEVNLFSKKIAGADYNVSIGLNRLGHQALFITKLGENDPFGTYIYETMKKEGFDTSQITFDPVYRTGIMLKNKVKDGDPEIAYYRKNSAASMVSPEDIDKVDFTGVDHIHLTGIGCAVSESCMEAAKEIIKKGKENHIPISFDPNLRPALWKSQEAMIESLNFLAFQSDIVLPGIEEGKILTEFEEKEKIADFYLQHGVKEVIIKMGGEGAYYKTSEKEGVVEGFSVKEIVDTVGAGDGFAVGVISGRLEQLPIEEYVKRGNCIGALQIQVEGDNEGLPNRERLQNALNG